MPYSLNPWRHWESRQNSVFLQVRPKTCISHTQHKDKPLLLFLFFLPLLPSSLPSFSLISLPFPSFPFPFFSLLAYFSNKEVERRGTRWAFCVLGTLLGTSFKCLNKDPHRDHINSLCAEFWLDLRSREASVLRTHEQKTRVHSPPAHNPLLVLTRKEAQGSGSFASESLLRNEHWIAKRSPVPGSMWGCQEKREVGSREGTWCLCDGIS